jgi:hypothetical protein
MTFPKDKPPHSVKVLHSWITTYAKETGQVPERIMRSVSYMIASLALERARDNAGTPLFLIKGGVMIELRLGLRARATRDLDAVFRAEFRSWLNQLDAAIGQPVGDFTLTRTEPEQIKRTNTKRLQLIIDYRGKRWAQIPLEIAPAEVPDVLESWRAPYREMAREENFEIETVDQAAALVTKMIAQIDAAT